jgi:hypothetical protein
MSEAAAAQGVAGGFLRTEDVDVQRVDCGPMHVTVLAEDLTKVLASHIGNLDTCSDYERRLYFALHPEADTSG